MYASLQRMFFVTAAVASACLFARSEPPASRLASVDEFPVTMEQHVTAGRTPGGTKVRAKLTLATLVKGTVIPEGAVFTGEVVESEAKSGDEPSRLSIRMNSVHWDKGSLPIKVFLTAWYYPLKIATRDPDDCQTPGGSTIGCPDSVTGPDIPDIAPLPRLGISDHRVVMKNVESTRQSDGALVLTSSHFDIKLDKTTTYVLATGDLTPRK